MRCAVIEIESDIISMGVFEKNSNSLYRIHYKDDFVGIINYISDGMITDVGISRLCDSIILMRDQANQLKCDKIKLIAKSSLRYLINKEQAIQEITNITGIKPEVLTAYAENKYLFSAFTNERKSIKSGILCDIGGSSTRVISFSGREIINETRLSIGCLNSYNMFVGGIIPTLKQEQEIKNYLRHIYKSGSPINTKQNKTRTIYFTGACVESVALLHMGIYGVDSSVNGYSFTLEKLKSARQILRGKIIDLPRLLSITVPNRVTTVMPCISILTSICELLGSQEIIISTCRLKDYVAQELMADKTSSKTEISV